VADRPDLHVLTLRRTDASTFVAGHTLFPGGAVDEGDHDPRWPSLVTGLSASAAAERLGVADGLGFWTAAVRETLEEVGVAVGTGDPVLAARLVEGRRDLEAGRIGLVDLVRESGTSLDLSGIHVVARWVTPMPSIKRYDTYFFVATVDPNVQPEVDGREAVHAEWCRPADVLERWRAGELTMISPTIGMFQRLASHGSATGVLAAAEAGGPSLRARILDDSTTPVRFEGDPGFHEPGTRESLGWVWLPAGDRPDPTTGWA
jgi:8-oxo-dGTP pyrophosphatase MutT (NUDIX family)